MGTRSIWPRQGPATLALTMLLFVQVSALFVATERSYFAHEDFYNFALAEDRPFLHYLVTPVIHTYPAPGLRLLSYSFHQLFGMNFLAARAVLLFLLAATTILLGHLVRSLADSDEWWTIALLTPFALSLTLVSSVNLWSNGIPVIPSLLLTVIALSMWVKSYTAEHSAPWIGLTAAAEAAAGGFYMKFLLIPLYLLLFRVLIFPRLLNRPASLARLWEERWRWLVIAIPPLVFVLVYALSGLAARSYIPGNRPYAEYLITAWVRVFVPVAVLNIPSFESPPSTAFSPAASGASWPIVFVSQALFWGIVAATCRRSTVAPRAWILFAVVFVANLLMVGSVRLPGFGLEIAYWLRYYPEVVLFIPIALALALRQGAGRRVGITWEHSRTGHAAIVLFACVQAIGLVVWAPRIVGRSDGVMARNWVDNLRGDVSALKRGQPTVRILDDDTPEYVVLSWMTPYNRVSTILRLLQLDAAYNDASGPAYVVLSDGHLAHVEFVSTGQILPDAELKRERVRVNGSAEHVPACARDGSVLDYRPDTEIVGDRLAVRVFYTANDRAPAALHVDTGKPDRRYRELALRPFANSVELIDLGTNTVRALRVESSPGGALCIERLEIGWLKR